MATIIKKGDKYAIEDNGVNTPVTQIVDNGKTLKLPTNSSNRQYFSIKTFDAKNVDGKLELTYKPTVKITRDPNTAPRTIKPIEDWLNEDDRKIFLELKEKAQKARDEANTKAPTTDLEKAQRALARAEAQLAKAEEAKKAEEANEPADEPAPEPEAKKSNKKASK